MSDLVAAFKLDKDFETPEGETMHISAFLLAKKNRKVLLARTKDYEGDLRWLLPSGLLKYGEHPDDAAKRLAKEWLGVNIQPKLRELQSHKGHHWDFCYVYEIHAPAKIPKKIGVEDVRFFDAKKSPFDDMGNGQESVLQNLGKKNVT